MGRHDPRADSVAMRRFWGLVLASATAAGVVGLAPNAGAAASPPWTTVELQPVAEGDVVVVYDINNAGTSVGWTEGSDVAVKWNGSGVATVLALPEGCTLGWAGAISDNGYIAGGATCGNDESPTGIEWLPNGTPVALPANTFARAIESHGLVVGEKLGPPTDGSGYLPSHAFAQIPGQSPRLDLPEAGAQESVPSAVTDFGYVVGTLYGVPGLPDNIAVGWYGSSVFPLLRTGLPTYGVAVNQQGVALVQTENGAGGRGYLVAPGGKTIEISKTGAADYLVDVNDYGIVTGTKATSLGPNGDGEGGTYFGELYAFGQSIKIRDIVSSGDAASWDYTVPTAINNGAWVVGMEATGNRAWIVKPPAA
jgi:hypothetical protein